MASYQDRGPASPPVRPGGSGDRAPQTTLGRRNRAFEVPDLIEAVTGFERALASPAGDTRLALPVRPVPARPQH